MHNERHPLLPQLWSQLCTDVVAFPSYWHTSSATHNTERGGGSRKKGGEAVRQQKKKGGEDNNTRKERKSWSGLRAPFLVKLTGEAVDAFISMVTSAHHMESCRGNKAVFVSTVLFTMETSLLAIYFAPTEKPKWFHQVFLRKAHKVRSPSYEICWLQTENAMGRRSCEVKVTLSLFLFLYFKPENSRES